MPENRDAFSHLEREIISTVLELYNSPDNKSHSLSYIAKELGISSLKVRKLLITAGINDGKTYYSSVLSERVGKLYTKGFTVDQIRKELGLSHASVIGYLPYSKQVYGLREISADAQRVRIYRQRVEVCRTYTSSTIGMSKNEEEAFLWETLVRLSGCPFQTIKGLKFTYVIKVDGDGNASGEMIIDRKKKSITRSTVLMAYWRARSLQGIVEGAKKLGTFGASYLYRKRLITTRLPNCGKI